MTPREPLCLKKMGGCRPWWKRSHYADVYKRQPVHGARFAAMAGGSGQLFFVLADREALVAVDLSLIHI